MTPNDHKTALLHEIGKAIHCAPYSPNMRREAAAWFDEPRNFLEHAHRAAMHAAGDVLPAIEHVLGPIVQRDTYLRKNLIALEVRDMDGTTLRGELKPGQDPMALLDMFVRPLVSA